MNPYERERRLLDYYRQKFPAGTRIELIQMTDDPRPVEPGTRGTVVHVDDMGQIEMHWDNGRSLSLVPGKDSAFSIHTKKWPTEEESAGLFGFRMML